jgi:hypothetical protein
MAETERKKTLQISTLPTARAMRAVFCRVL